MWLSPLIGCLFSPGRCFLHVHINYIICFSSHSSHLSRRMEYLCVTDARFNFCILRSQPTHVGCRRRCLRPLAPPHGPRRLRTPWKLRHRNSVLCIAVSQHTRCLHDARPATTNARHPWPNGSVCVGSHPRTFASSKRRVASVSAIRISP